MFVSPPDRPQSTIAVRAIDAADPAARARWDQAVRARADATMFHLAAWPMAIAETFGHRFWLLAAERDGVIVGLLPLILVRSRLFGTRLASTPSRSTVATADDRGRARHAGCRAIRLRDETGASLLEYRNLHRLRPDWPAKTDVYARFQAYSHAGRQHEGNCRQAAQHDPQGRESGMEATRRPASIHFAALCRVRAQSRHAGIPALAVRR